MNNSNMAKRKLKIKILMQIEDISDSKGEAYSATLPEYNNAVVMGRDMNELLEGVQAFLEYWEENQKRQPAIPG
jgi:hypothetical protein